MKPFTTQAHINSLKGGLAEITVLEEKELYPRQQGYIVDYGGVICTAIFNPFSCSYYVDDIYGRIEQ